MCLKGRVPRNQAQKEVRPDPRESLHPVGEVFHCPLGFGKSLRGDQQQRIVMRVEIQDFFC